MGVEVPDVSIDYEIRELIKSLNKLSFLQTIGSCSGWTDSEISEIDGVSDGINRKWKGQPYIQILSLDDKKMIDFVKYIYDRIMINQDINTNNVYKKIEDQIKIYRYIKELSSVGLKNDYRQLIHFVLDYKNDKILFILYIYEFNRDIEYIQKIWNLLTNIVNDYLLLYGEK